MSIRDEKPMLSIDGQINHLISKGVKFELMTVEEAREYLNENNNYFKLRAYRRNFDQHPGGANKGRYINLDFAMLKDLSIIDMRMRYVFMQMAMDIEHFAKVKLLRCVQESGDDGYQIVEDYFQFLRDTDAEKGTHHYDKLKGELDRNRLNHYCGGIIEKYDGEYPVWAFVEVISLGTLVNFYQFCADRLDRTDMINEGYLLIKIKELRNASAHSNCIIHALGKKDATYRIGKIVYSALTPISKGTKRTQIK